MPFIPLIDGKQRWNHLPSLKARIRIWLNKHIRIPILGKTIRSQTIENSVINAKLIKYTQCTFIHCEFLYIEDCVVENSHIYYESPNLNIGAMPFSEINNCILHPNTPKSA